MYKVKQKLRIGPGRDLFVGPDARVSMTVSDVTDML